MQHIKVPVKEEVSEANRQAFERLQNIAGVVPNLYAVMAHSENALTKCLDSQFAPTSLTNREKEAVNLAISQLNGCTYCLAAHTVLGKMNGFAEEEILQLRKGQSNDAKLQAIVQLAIEIAGNKGAASQKTRDTFYAAGYNAGNLIDLVQHISDKIFMNHLYALTQVPIDFPAAPAL